jgi:hypothetical protein
MIASTASARFDSRLRPWFRSSPRGELAAVDDAGAELGHVALGQLRILVVKHPRQHELQDRVAQELEPLVVGDVLLDLMPARRMGQRLPEQGLVLEGALERGLEFLKGFGGHARRDLGWNWRWAARRRSVSTWV